MKVSFDIGGVLSKYPHVFRPLVKHLQDGGADVYVLTDMHDHDQSVRFVRGNGYDIPSENILNSDYSAYGETCKAKMIRDHGIDIHIDDFPGYCAHTECVSLFVWPNPREPYYHDDFKTDGSEGNFGRRTTALAFDGEEDKKTNRFGVNVTPALASLREGREESGEEKGEGDG